MSLYLWKTESTKLLKLSLVRVKLISISLVVAVLNSMSGGTGGLDALLPLSLICGYLCEASIKPSLKTSTIKDLMGKLSYFIQEFHINKLPLFIISCLPLAGAISIKNNGYKWWGIYENRPLQSIFNRTSANEFIQLILVKIILAKACNPTIKYHFQVTWLNYLKL